jgi:hypothetical protein
MCCGQKRSVMKGSPHLAVPMVNSTSRGTQVVPVYVVAQGFEQNRPGVTNSHPMGQSTPHHTASGIFKFKRTSIRYLQSSTIWVKGQVTGLHYQFSSLHPVQVVDSRDASPLLNSRLFRRA